MFFVTLIRLLPACNASDSEDTAKQSVDGLQDPRLCEHASLDDTLVFAVSQVPADRVL